MREILDDIERWRKAGESVALARVIGVEGSGPREPGAAMAVNGKGETLPEVAGVAERLKVCGDDCAVLFGNEVWANPQAAEKPCQRRNRRGPFTLSQKEAASGGFRGI